ncbi:hypothetical protein HNS03_22790 [Amorphus sp. 3PC139-8]
MLLTAALVGPFLVDWTVYRDLIETQAEKLLGEEVRVLGQADVRLLPAPRISLETVRVGPQDEPIFTADRVELEVDLSPLLKREIDVVALSFFGPEVHVTVEPDGSVEGPVLHLAQGPLEWVDPAKVRFDQIDVRRGRLLIDDRRTGETARVDGINMTGSGRSFHGPFEGAGSLDFDGSSYDLRFATGSHVIGAPLTVKARVRPTARPVDFTVDGEATLSSAPARFTGALTVAPRPNQDDETPAVPWSIEGTLDVAPNALTIPEAEIRYGPIERPVVMRTSLQVPFHGDEGFRLNLAARQMDLDGLLKAMGHSRDGGRPAERLAPLLGALDAVPALESNGSVSARFVSIIAGGAVIENASVEAQPSAQGWRIVSARAGLPGDTAVSTSGQLQLGDERRYDGDVEVVSEKPGALARWWRGGSGGTIPVRSLVSVDGALKIGGGEIAMPAMRLRSGEATVLGSLRYRPGSERVRAALDLDLRSDRIDLAPFATMIGSVSEGSGLASGIGGDVTLYLTADEATLGGVTANGVELDAALIDDAFTLDHLQIADLGGTRLEVSGNFGEAGDRPSGRLSGRLEGDRLSDLARLADDLAPGNAFVRRFGDAAGDFAPVALNFELSGDQSKEGGTLDLSVSGTAGGTEIKMSGEANGQISTWRDAEIDASLRASNSDGDRLMRQLGLAVLPVGSDVAGDVAFAVTGAASDGLSVDGEANLVGATLKAGGTVVAAGDAPPTVDLDLSLVSDDLSLPALASGRALPLLAGGVPVSLSAQATGPLDDVAVSGLDGRVAGIRLSGGGTADLSGDLAHLDGNITIGEVDLQVLTELLLGGETWTYAGETLDGWPDAPFGPSALAGVDLDLDVTTDRLWIGARDVRNAQFGLSLAPDRLLLSDLSGRYGGGDLEGALDLSRSDGQATLSGRLALSDAELAGLVWSAEERPVATGSLDLALDFQAMGRSVQAMVAALSGSGSFTARDGLIRHLDPDAILAAIRQADAAGDVDVDADAVRAAVSDGLDGGSLAFTQLSGTIGIASGIARIGEVTVETDAADVSGSGSIDLPAWTLSGAVDLSLTPPDPDLVPDVTADIGLDFAGPLDAPSVELGVDPLVGYLTLRETERERRRLEALEKELQERRRRQEEMLRRLEEERRAEAERQRQEEERRRAEEAARAAEEAARAAEEQRAAAGAEVAPAEPEPRPTLESPEIGEGSATSEAPPAPSTLPSAGVLSPDPSDPIGSLIDRGPRLLWPTPLGPPSEIGPPPRAGRAPLDLRAPTEQRSQAPDAPAAGANPGPFTIEQRDLGPLPQ